MLRIALPNKGTLAEPAATMMREAGYRQRNDSRDLSMLDEENDIEFFYLRPKDIATYVGSGDLQLGITGADLMDESGSQVRSVIALGFGQSKFRFAAPDRGIDGREWKLEDLEGKKIATSYPRLVRAHLARNRVRADIIKLDGAVEISVQLNLADAIADVVSSGRTLRQHNLVAFGDPIAESEATLIEREPRPDREETVETKQEKVGLHRAAARRRLRPEVPHGRLRLPAARAGRGQGRRARHAGAHRVEAAGRGLVRRAHHGAQARGEPDHGRVGEHRRAGDPDLGDPVLPGGRRRAPQDSPAHGEALRRRPMGPRSSNSRPADGAHAGRADVVCASTAIHAPVGRAVQVDGELGVDEEPLADVERGGGAVARVGHQHQPLQRARAPRRPPAAPAAGPTPCPARVRPASPRSQRHSSASMKPGQPPRRALGAQAGLGGGRERGGGPVGRARRDGRGVADGEPPRPRAQDDPSAGGQLGGQQRDGAARSFDCRVHGDLACRDRARARRP